MGDSQVIETGPCPSDECGSSDAFKTYDDGHGYCYSCGHYEPSTDDASANPSGGSSDDDSGVPAASVKVRIEGDVVALVKRGIKEETCKHFGYRVGEYGGQNAQLAYYYDPVSRKPVGAKVRFPDKSFTIIGNVTDYLYGQHLCRDGGKKLVITEGEIDCLSVAQAQGLKWPVVSVPNGAKGAAKALAKHLEWLDKFEEVILFFDMDEPGRQAAVECAQLLPPGKAKLAVLPEGYKDANDCTKAGKPDFIIDAIWGAREYRPDGIISGAEITREELQEPIAGYALRMPRLNEMMGGIREGELTLLTAGSGIGKSTLAREIAYGLHQDHGLTIGNIFLEENNKKSAQGYVAIHNNIPLGKLRKDPGLLTDEQWDASLAAVVHKRMYFYDHFGSMESDNLLAKIKYMRVALGCHFVVLDHISIVVSGAEGSGEGERRDIDKLMTKLRSLVEATGLGIIAIVHLKQPEGKPHEEGGRVTLSQLRGSGSLKQLSDNVIALERDQQDEEEAHKSQARVLKCREFGETGEADVLGYNRETGRLLPVPDEPSFEDESGDF